MFLICSYLPEPYPNAARLLAAIPSSALLWWRLLHKTGFSASRMSFFPNAHAASLIRMPVQIMITKGKPSRIG
jgi:hypothetical protein